MCLALLHKQGNKTVQLTDGEFKTAWTGNPDGFGMFWTEKKTLRYVKCLEYESALASYNKYFSENIKTSHIVCHFRFGTHGEKTKANCHPFFISQELGFVHNGIIKINSVGVESDTATFNRVILKKLPDDFLKNHATIELLRRYIDGSKLVFLNTDNHYTIIGENAGHWKNKTWFSNYGYAEKKYSLDFYNDWDIEYFNKYQNYRYSPVVEKKRLKCDFCNIELITKKEEQAGCCHSCCLNNYGTTLAELTTVTL